MKYNPAIHKRKSVRLKGYDYWKEGLYFITICTQNRELLFGRIEDDEMILNDAGKMVEDEWVKLPVRFPNIELHEFVVMPNHFHAILEILEVSADMIILDVTDGQSEETGMANAPFKKTLGNIVAAFKSLTTVEYIFGVKAGGWRPFNRKLWQRSFHDHIIRDWRAYNNIRIHQE